MLPTCLVTCTLYDQSGFPDVGAVIKAKLNSYDVYNGGYIAPEEVVSTTDANGQSVLSLWPNELGIKSTYYIITITSTSGKTLRMEAVVPNLAETNLHEIGELLGY